MQVSDIKLTNGGMAVMIRKKAACLLSIILMFLVLASCSESNSQIKAIQDRGVLRVGVKVDVPRFGYLNPSTGEMEGIEVDLACAIAKDILGDENAVRFINITAQTRAAMLDNGEIDIVIATFTITEERKKSFNFSRAYYTDELGYLVCTDSSISKPEELDGKSAGVMRGSTSGAALEEESARMGISITVREYASYPETKAALENGDVDVFVTDKSILFGYMDDTHYLLEYGFKPQDYGVACKLENDKLAARIDSILETLENNGVLAEIIAKWDL